MLGAMKPAAALPLFHLYGDPPDDQAFDFVHVETLSSRSSIHNWTIQAHRHRNLFQIFVIERGGGEMFFETATIAFKASCAILVPPTVAHGFRFLPEVSEGWVVTFTEDVAEAIGERSAAALERLKALASDPVVPLASDGETRRLAALCRDLYEEHFHIAFYAAKLAVTPDRLNDHVKRAAGVTAGHLIRQRVLTEAKRQLVFTNLSIGEIAYDLAFADPSHFARFFRKQTGTTPQAFRSRGHAGDGAGAQALERAARRMSA